jgi:hypothetical protein
VIEEHVVVETKIQRGWLEKHLNGLALNILKPHGFRHEDDGCLREFEGGAQYVGIAVTDTGGKNSINPFGQTGLLLPLTIKEHFCGPKRMMGLGQFQVEYSYFSGIPWRGRPCQTQADLPETEVWLHDFLTNQMLPCIKRYSDPREILHAYLLHDEKTKNTTDVLSWNGWGSAVTGLIFAKLYGPEHYVSLRERYSRIFVPLLPEYKEQVLNLLAYLDQDPLPPLSSAGNP